MKTTQIATVLVVGPAVVGLAFVGPVSAHDGTNAPTIDSTWNDSPGTANDTHWNAPESVAGTAQWPRGMVGQFGQDHLAWMSNHMSDRHLAWMTPYPIDGEFEWTDERSNRTDGQWSANGPSVGPGSGDDRGVSGSGYGMGGPGYGMHGAGVWSADQPVQQSSQQFTGGYGGPMGGWAGHGC